MAIHHKLLAFDRRLTGATLPGRSARLYSESEMAAARVEAYQQGSDFANSFANQQLVEMRAGVQALQEGLFARLGESDSVIFSQLRTALPGVVVEVARRLLAGFEPPAEVLEKLCRETLEHLYPERENLELLVSPRDAELLSQLNPAWKQSYPGLKITAEPALQSGDCQVRSRFGLTDARLSSKLETLSRELLAAN